MNLALRGVVKHLGNGVFKIGDEVDSPIVNLFGENVPTCTNEDWTKRSHRTLGQGYYCGHIDAVAYHVYGSANSSQPPSDEWGNPYPEHEAPPAGSIYRPKRSEKTAGGFKRHGFDYDKALRGEFGDVIDMALAVTKSIELSRSHSARGRTTFSMSSMIFAGLMFAYFGRGYRFTESFLEKLNAWGVIADDYPGFALLGEFIRDFGVTPHLRRLLRETGALALPISNLIFAMDMTGKGRQARFDYRLQQRMGKESTRDRPIRLIPDDDADAAPLSDDELATPGPVVNRESGKIRKGYYRVNALIDVDLMVTLAIVVTDHRVHESRPAVKLIRGLLSCYASPNDIDDDVRRFPENATMEEIEKAIAEGKFDERFDPELPPRILGDGGYRGGRLRKFVKQLGGELYAPYSVNQKHFEPGILTQLRAKVEENPRKYHEILRYRVKIESHNAAMGAVFGNFIRAIEGAGPENTILLQYILGNLRFVAMAARCYELDIPALCKSALTNLDDRAAS